MFKTCLFLAASVACVLGYPNGAPPASCLGMIPRHRMFAPETDPSPYKVTAPVEKCKREVTVTLSGTSQILGFLCQPRPVKDMPRTSGAFEPLGDVTQMKNSCPSMTSLCHTSNEPKSSVQFKWTPTKNETVYIVCTVVEDFDRFWVMQTSGPVALDLDDPSCNSSPPLTTRLSPKMLMATFLALFRKRN